MTDTTTLAEAAMRRLRHSIGTSAGMHKLQIRRQAQAIRDSWPPMPEPRRLDPAMHDALYAALGNEFFASLNRTPRSG